MAFFTDKQMQFMYNHKILSFLLFALAIIIVLGILILLILAAIYGPKTIFDISSWF